MIMIVIVIIIIIIMLFNMTRLHPNRPTTLLQIWYAYDKDHMGALRIKNTSESDPHSYEVTLNKSMSKIRLWKENLQLWQAHQTVETVLFDVRDVVSA